MGAPMSSLLQALPQHQVETTPAGSFRTTGPSSSDLPAPRLDGPGAGYREYRCAGSWCLFPVQVSLMPIVDLWQEPDDCRVFHSPVAVIVTWDLHVEDCRWLPHWLVQIWWVLCKAVARDCTCPSSQKNHCYHRDIAKNTPGISSPS